MAYKHDLLCNHFFYSFYILRHPSEFEKSRSLPVVYTSLSITEIYKREIKRNFILSKEICRYNFNIIQCFQILHSPIYGIILCIELFDCVRVNQ